MFLRLFFPGEVVELGWSAVVVGCAVGAGEFAVFDDSKFGFFGVIFGIVEFFGAVGAAFFGDARCVFGCVLRCGIAVDAGVLCPVVRGSDVAVDVGFFRGAA